MRIDQGDAQLGTTACIYALSREVLILNLPTRAQLLGSAMPLFECTTPCGETRIYQMPEDLPFSSQHCACGGHHWFVHYGTDALNVG